ncbi:MAG: hypothetical protein OWR62_15940, partial [Sulfobacillus thermotolerans]|nr:hypothetical protein [Sulfobacillus thermotolerans]
RWQMSKFWGPQEYKGQTPWDSVFFRQNLAQPKLYVHHVDNVLHNENLRAFENLTMEIIS